jgi:hypothetical protein
MTMKAGFLVGGLFAVSTLFTPLVANAQSTNEDVRCLMVSSVFARIAKDDNTRRASAMTGAFYLGRLNGRISPAALTAAIKSQDNGMPAKQAEPIMRACAARATAAQEQVAAIARQLQPVK